MHTHVQRVQEFHPVESAVCMLIQTIAYMR